MGGENASGGAEKEAKGRRSERWRLERIRVGGSGGEGGGGEGGLPWSLCEGDLQRRVAQEYSGYSTVQQQGQIGGRRVLQRRAPMVGIYSRACFFLLN